MNENSTPVPNNDQLDPASAAPPLPAVTQNLSFVRQSGGQPGNQNARRHGLYSRYLPPELRQDYEEAHQIRGIAAERALLRTKLAEMLAKDPDNAALINKLIKTISKLEASRPAGEDGILSPAREKAYRIMAYFYKTSLEAGDKVVVEAFDRWMRENHGG